MKLDLGCGSKLKRQNNNTLDYIGVDICDHGQEVRHDITKFPYPHFASESVDEIFCSHSFENIVSTPREIKNIFREWYRLTKPGGKWVLILPHWTRSHCFFVHRIGFQPDFINNFTRKKEVDSYDNLELEIIKVTYQWRLKGLNPFFDVFNYFYSKLLNLSGFLTEQIFCYWFGGIFQMTIEVKVK